MLVKLETNYQREGNSAWDYYEKVSRITNRIGRLVVEKTSVPEDVSICVNDGRETICSYDRILLHFQAYDEDGLVKNNHMVRIITLFFSSGDAIRIISDCCNKAFICNDEGKTIDRI